jgi:hypothetical protein
VPSGQSPPSCFTVFPPVSTFLFLSIKPYYWLQSVLLSVLYSETQVPEIFSTRVIWNHLPLTVPLACNLSIGEAEAGESGVQDQPRLHSRNLPQKIKNKKRQCWQGYGGIGTSQYAGGQVKWCNSFGTQLAASPEINHSCGMTTTLHHFRIIMLSERS